MIFLTVFEYITFNVDEWLIDRTAYENHVVHEVYSFFIRGKEAILMTDTFVTFCGRVFLYFLLRCIFFVFLILEIKIFSDFLFSFLN